MRSDLKQITILSLPYLFPQKVQFLQPRLRRGRRIGLLLRNFDEFADRCFRQRHNPSVFHNLVAEIQNQDDDDVEIGADECFRVPTE